MGIASERYGLVTLHRPANVDDDRQRTEILDALTVISEDLELFWPVHPRTRARLEQGSVALPRGFISWIPWDIWIFFGCRRRASWC